MVTIDPRSAIPIYRQVIDQVRRAVITGRLAPGDQVESVANLAARARVNPMTVSKAYSALVEQGVLERRRGVGLFVAHQPQTRAETARRDLLDGALREVAALVVQLQIDAEEAARRLVGHIDAQQRQGDDHA